MTETTPPTNRVPARKPQEVDAIAEWRSTLTGLTGALLLRKYSPTAQLRWFEDVG